MHKLRALLLRLIHFVRGRKDGAAEFESHIPQPSQDGIRAGDPPALGRRTILGPASPEEVNHQLLERRTFSLLESLIQDTHFSLRTLSRNPAFTVIAVLTLALGIGASTAVFSIVNAVLIRSLPYGEPGRLVNLYTPNPQLP
jgi:hypothetical protein